MPPSKTSHRKTIAVFASQVGRAWGSEFITGISDAAEANNVNVVHFIGGTLRPFVAPNNKISFGLYDLAKPDQFDGFILAADVGYGSSLSDFNQLRETYGHLPIITQSVEIPGASVFIPDNAGGMRSVMRHLIEDHGYKRIAFIRGLRGQLDAEQRYEAYQDELRAHDMRFDERLVVDGDYTSESGRLAIQT